MLNLIDIGETDYTKYAKRSMVQNDIDVTIKGYYDNICSIQKEIDNMMIILDSCKTDFKTVEEYIYLKYK